MSSDAARRLRRYPSRSGRTGDLRDVDILAQLGQDLGEHAARAYDAVLQAEYRSERAHARYCRPEADLGPGAIDALLSADHARATHGPGGGRRRPTRRPDA